jgi:shikimate kinase
VIGKRNYYLIGPMGSGKTAVGRRLATLLDMDFFDSDVEIEKRTGVDIRFIFEKEGEARFRVRECEVIADLTALRDVVIATGGGAVLDPVNRRHLATTGTVIYLQASVDAQLTRTEPTRNRPLLMGQDPRAVLERLIAIRRPLYEEIADITIETTGRQVRTVAADLHELLTASN